MALLSGVLVLALVCAFSLCLAARTGLDAALLPLPTLAGAVIVLLAGACGGVLRPGLWVLLAALAAGTAFCAVQAGTDALRKAACSPGWLLFGATALFFWLLLALHRPMFTQWDEFTAWGLAPKMVKQLNALYVAAPYNLTASHTLPGTSLVTYLFLAFSPAFEEWSCMAALDTLAMACAAAAAGGLKDRRWPAGVAVFAVTVLLPFWFSAQPAGTPNTVYANAMADTSLGLVFGGALCLYFAAPRRRTGLVLAVLPLALLALLKDIAFAYGLIAAFVIALDLVFCAPGKTGRRLELAAGTLCAAAVPVVLAFVGWNRYTAAADPQTAGGAVGSAGLSYGAVLLGGARQLLGIGREEKFAELMRLMGSAFLERQVALIGGCWLAAALAVCIAAAAALTAPKGEKRRPAVLCAGLGFCFAALYAFHLILYHYNFAELEALALQGYERYLTPYFIGWLMPLLGLLGRGGRRGGQLLALGTAALVGVIAWHGMPAAGFWSNADSLYTQRADVQRRAAAANEVLDWGDRVLVLSQGDDATRWYYYKYELTARVVNGYGGIWRGDEDFSSRWDSDFMNLVESLNWEIYDFKAQCNAHTLVAYMAEKNCDYLLIDRADGYLEEEFSPIFAGGLDADMPATLFRFEGPDEAIAFTPVAVAESGVTG